MSCIVRFRGRSDAGMTVIDLFMQSPLWLQVVIVFLLVVWLSEIFLYPFKQNIHRKRMKDLMELQQKTIGMLEQKDVDLENTNKMLATMISLVLKREQKDEGKRDAK